MQTPRPIVLNDSNFEIAQTQLLADDTSVFYIERRPEPKDDWWQYSIMQVREGEPTPRRIAQMPYLPDSLVVDSSHLSWLMNPSKCKLEPDSGALVTVAKGGGTPAVLSKSPWPYYLKADSTHFFWSDRKAGGILRMEKRGGKPELIIHDSSAREIALDEDHLYWFTEEIASNSTYAIMTATKGGAHPRAVIKGLVRSQGLRMDGSHIYWTDLHGSFYGVPSIAGKPECGHGSRLMRAEKDGSRPTLLYCPIITFYEMTVGDKHICWTEPEGDRASKGFLSSGPNPGQIKCIKKSGGKAKILASVRIRPMGILLAHGNLYWGDDKGLWFVSRLPR